jgi:hypothetical protein
MGDAVRIPDRHGWVIPSVLLGVLATGGGLFFRAGQIVQNQNVQNEKVTEVLERFEAGVQELEDTKRDVRALEEQVQRIEKGTTEFIQASMQRQADLGASLDSTTLAIREELKRQQLEHRLLKDYTEARIDHLPYKPSGETDG